MSTLTARYDAPTRAVELTVTSPAPIAGITRSDANGTRPVRMRTDQIHAAGTFQIIDYEPAIAGRIQYVLTTDATAAPAWVEIPAAQDPTFVLPAIPQFTVTVENVHGYSAGRESRATFHTIINRDDPIVAEGGLTPRTGTLEVFAAQYMDALNLENMIQRGQCCLYRQSEHAGMDMYFYASASDIEPDEGAWKLTLSYVEVSFPPGNVLSGAGWTFDALANEGGTFLDLPARFESFHDLAIKQERAGA